MGNILGTSRELRLGNALDVKEIPNKGIQVQASALKMLQALLKANHNTYGVLYNNRLQPNLLSHYLISAYYLGASTGKISEIYEQSVTVLEPLEEDSPTELTEWDWQTFFSDTRYERSYLDYFTDKVVESINDWQDVVRYYLIDKKMIYACFGNDMVSLVKLATGLDTDDDNFGISTLTSISMDYVNAARYLDFGGSTSEQKSLDFGSLLQDLSSDPAVKQSLLESTATSTIDFVWTNCPRVTEYYLQKLELLDLSDKAVLTSFVFGYMRAASSLLNGAQNKQSQHAAAKLVILAQSLAEIAFNESQKIFVTKNDQELLGKIFWLTMISYCALYSLAPRAPEREPKASNNEVDWKEMASKALDNTSNFGFTYCLALRALLFATNIDKEYAGLYQQVAARFTAKYEK